MSYRGNIRGIEVFLIVLVLAFVLSLITMLKLLPSAPNVDHKSRSIERTVTNTELPVQN